MDIKPVSDYIAKVSGLPQIELVWLLGWNIVAGEWQRIGLNPTAGKELLTDLFSKLQGDPSDLSKKSATRLQHCLMALRVGTFEAIQQEAPFSRFAQSNMKTLLQAWRDGGAAGLTRVWNSIFHTGWEAERESPSAIRIVGVGEVGDCEARALEVVGAPDRETRVAAEWWYLRYTFGLDWTPGMHMTTAENENGDRFSVHNIELSDGSCKQIFFRLPW